MKVREDRLNEHFSQSEFKLDQGEALLKEMQQLRDELSQYEDEVSDIGRYTSHTTDAKLLVSLKLFGNIKTSQII